MSNFPNESLLTVKSNIHVLSPYKMRKHEKILQDLAPHNQSLFRRNAHQLKNDYKETSEVLGKACSE